jgi:hypothetical protein
MTISELSTHSSHSLEDSLVPLRQKIETGKVWLENYREDNAVDYLQRRWKLDSDSRPALELIKTLPSHLRPHLPEGYIWFEESGQLKLLRHQYAPQTDFKVYLFGPDNYTASLSNHRVVEHIQYLVASTICNQQVPIQGFALTEKGREPRKELRKEFPEDITLSTYKDKTQVWWRGHLIDFLDTMGEGELTSTHFSLNYKPEPAGAWARTLRTQVTREAREAYGSYSEVIHYREKPSMTEGKLLIPESISIETFSRDATKINGYFVPAGHECHQWIDTGGERFFKKCLKKLADGASYSALSFEAASLLSGLEGMQEQFTKVSFSTADLRMVSARDQFVLRRMAEIESASADCLLTQVTHVLNSSTNHRNRKVSERVHHWLRRATEMAEVIDFAYQGRKPSFKVITINGLLSCYYGVHFRGMIERLRAIACRMLLVQFPLNMVPYHLMEMAGEKSEISEVAQQRIIVLIEVGCKVGTLDESALMRVVYEIEDYMAAGFKVHLTDVYTRLSDKLFPLIAKISDYTVLKPIRRITVSNRCWYGSIVCNAKALLQLEESAVHVST